MKLNFNKIDVITIGTATRDVFLRSRYFKEFHDKDLKKIGIKSGVAECMPWGAKIDIEKPVLTVGGGAANAAVTFARQGFKTSALFKVGDDRSGEGVVSELKKEGVKTLALYDKKLGTAYSTLLLSPAGERTVLVYRGAASDINVAEVPYKNLKAKWAYIAPSAIPLRVMERIVNALHKDGAHIVMNPSGAYIEMSYKKLEPMLNKLSVMTLNKEEAESLAGGKKLQEIFKGILVISDGPRGVSVFVNGREYHAGIYKERRLLDRTGAGDAFGSGFVAALARKLRTKNLELRTINPETIKYAIRLGSANATSVVEYIGAQEGILTKQQFGNKRWKSLTISKK